MFGGSSTRSIRWVGVVAAAILIGGLSAEPAFGNPGLVRFAKALSTTIPATGTGPGPASVYPSSITYDWCPGAIADLDVDISAFGHTSPDDVDIVLQGPTGQSTMLMSDAGGGTDVEDLTLGFDDEAVSDLPDSTALSTGQFEPTDFGTVDAMPAPAPDPTTAALSVFDGTNPVGTWSLFVADDAAVDTGDIEFNWRIDMLVTSQAAGTEICVPNAGVGEPYPSEQTISGRTSSVQDLNVSLHGLRHRFNTDGLDVLLQGPAGQTTVLMSDAGGSDGLSNVTLTFDDEAAASLPDEAQISSGSFKPANFEGSDAFPFPAPGAPHGDTLDAFDGSDPNGTWKLFIRNSADDLGGTQGVLDSWSLEITTPAATVAVKARKVKEGKSQSFTLTRTENLGVSETVSYATKNGSAKGGKDYKAAAGIVTFGVGEGSKKVKVKTKNDGRDERNERFFLTVTAGGVTSRGAARIKDND